MLTSHISIALTLYLIGRMEDMANNFDRLSAAVDNIAARVEEVATEIRNPSVDNNDQEVIDDLAGRLEGAADALRMATDEERAEDAGPAEEPPVEPEPEPAPESEQPTV